MKPKFWLPLVFAILFAAGLWVGVCFLGPKMHNYAGNEKLNEVMALIHERYVDEVSIDSLVEMTLPLLLSNLDPHSAYIPASDYEKTNSELEGKFSGIGISFQIMNDTLTVVESISGGPAERVGVMAGDRIIKVGDREIAGPGNRITENDVFGLLRGEKGTHVTITVKRNSSKKPIVFEITRDDIPVESIDAAYMIDPEVGYVRIARFARNTYSDFLNALNDLRLQGAQSFIVDLRYNGGGYMEPAVLMANEFLAPGMEIVSTRGRDVRENQFILSDGTGSFADYGLVVLINEFSASASEIFSGAIQDNDRGWIVGRRSFGKGLVQSPILMPDSSEVRLTVQRYYTPSGRSIQKDYVRGDISAYDYELINRFAHGESVNIDSIKLKTDLVFKTISGREVYGGGGIMPDVFVPEDTTSITSYYTTIVNQSLPSKFAYEYTDLNREQLNNANDLEELLQMLPSDWALLDSFVQYAKLNGVPARWHYIQPASQLILDQVKANIARNILGISGFYQVMNLNDNAVATALEYAKKGSPVSSADHE